MIFFQFWLWRHDNQELASDWEKIIENHYLNMQICLRSISNHFKQKPSRSGKHFLMCSYRIIDAIHTSYRTQKRQTFGWFFYRTAFVCLQFANIKMEEICMLVGSNMNTLRTCWSRILIKEQISCWNISQDGHEILDGFQNGAIFDT